MSQSDDVNFDGRAERFIERIYGSAKGELRLSLLWEDMLANIPTLARPGLRVWEAGGGAGHMARRLAAAGQRVLLSDISADMLALAERELGAQRARVDIRHASIQTLAASMSEHFGLIVCHAVLEWLSDPHAALRQLATRLEPGGHLSLMFYNINSLILTHALHGNVKKLKAEDFIGHPGGLTPSNPQVPEQVLDWLRGLGFEIVSQCGIRTISEYLPESPRFDAQLMLDLERQYNRRPPFLQLARYLHVVCRRPL